MEIELLIDNVAWSVDWFNGCYVVTRRDLRKNGPILEYYPDEQTPFHEFIIETLADLYVPPKHPNKKAVRS